MKAEFTISQIRKFNKKGFRSIAARFVLSALIHYDEILESLKECVDTMERFSGSSKAWKPQINEAKKLIEKSKL